MIGKASFYPEFFTEGLRSMFFDIYNSTPSGNWSAITTVTQSDKDKEKYGEIGSIPAMHEWLEGDEREVLGITDKFTYEIVNKKYELTLGVPRTVLEDEQYGRIKSKINGMAIESKRLKDSLIFGLLTSGTTLKGYDGVAMFSTTHNINGTNQSNALSTAFSKTSLQAAITAMRKFKNDKGNPLGMIPDTLVVNPDLEWDARELLNASSWVATGVGSTAAVTPNVNLLKGSLNLIVSEHLTSATEWYIMDTKHAIKPLILQERIPLEFAALDNPQTGENAFKRDQFLYGIRERFGLGFGPWFTCIQGDA